MKAVGAEQRNRVRLRFEELEARNLLALTTAVASGEWDDPAVWSAGVPDDTDRAVIPSGYTVTLTGTDHVAEELVIQGVLEVAEAAGADFDGSGTVDGSDFLSWQQGNGDADGDSNTDASDLGLWQQQYATAGTGGGATKTLTADWIHVNSGGVFQIGTAANRYDANDFVVTLTGEDPNAEFTNVPGVGTISNNNAFLMAAGGGRLQFFGKEKLTFTKLAATAQAGTSQILVENAIDRNHDGNINATDGSLNWEVGDQIVIASSSEDYDDEEVRIITAIADQGNGTSLITLDQTLSKRHYGEIETYGNGTRTWDIDLRAEVAILNRNVRIQGLASHDTDNFFGDRARFNAGTGDGFAGHTMIMGSAGQITIDSVQFDRMGQTGRLGRYPVHWHIAGDRSGDILRGSSVTNSNNRGVTIHTTHNVLVEGNVLHDIHGHGFFMEDAVETGNQYLHNIAFGIHKVGRSAAVGNFAPDPNDPFIVDTHDFVGQNANRFLSSSAYWITNPDNTWIGNISAGSEGTGFWFILPDEAIGAASGDPQYNNVNAERTNLRQFDHNSSHSSPAGLNFDRGSDIEKSLANKINGITPIKAFFDGDNYLPPQEPQVNYYTGYKHNVALYHRGFDANFHENRYADNFITSFITFTQRITDTLFVGHSQGNADLTDRVTGHTIYDGANTLDGNHFAGFADDDAHTFRVHSAANRFTSHVLSNTTFENDGTAASVSIATQSGGSNHNQAVGGASPAAIYDVDGTLTGHVGGGAGRTVVTNHPFFYDSNDFQPAGWNAWVSDDVYAQLFFRPTNQGAEIRVTSPDGDSGSEENVSSFNTHVKTNDGDYVVDFPEGVGSISSGLRVKHFQRVGPNNGSTVIRFEDLGNVLAPAGVPFVASLTTLRNSNNTVYTVVGNDLYVKFFSSGNEINFVTAPSQTNTLWQDDDPASGITNTSSNMLQVTQVSGSAATGDSSRALVGQVVLGSGPRFKNINTDELTIDPQYRGTEYSYTIDYFVPPGTTLDDPGGNSPDVFYVQMNFNGQNTHSAGFVSGAAAGSGWNTITLTDTVPSNATTAQPFFIVADGGFNGGPVNGNGSGVAFYIDNINFTVGLSGSAASSVQAATSGDDSGIDFVPLAIAANLGSVVSPAETPSLALSSFTPVTAPVSGDTRRDLALASFANELEEFPAADDAEQHETVGPWLSDELLEQVFS